MARGARGHRRRVGRTTKKLRSKKMPATILPTPVAPASASFGPPDEVLEEVLASLTIKRRRFLRHYLATGNARQAVRAAGYNCTTPQSETSVAQEILEHPLVQHAQRALLHAEGLSAAGLRQIHAIHLARHSSPDGGDRDRSLRATALAYKYLRPPPAPAGTKPLLDQLLDEMTPEELRRFADSGLWPVRFASRLGQAPAADDRSGSGTGGAPEPSADAPSAEPALAPLEQQLSKRRRNPDMLLSRPEAAR
jgi:hypothetical protein